VSTDLDNGFDIASELRPTCDVQGCELLSQFHGFGRDVCWQHYSTMIVSGAFLDRNPIERKPVDSPQLDLFCNYSPQLEGAKTCQS